MGVGGRKSKYETLEIAKKLPLIRRLRRQGKTEKEIFDRLGIKTTAAYEYKKKYPEFAKALIHSADELGAEIAETIYQLANKKTKVTREEKYVRDKETGKMVLVSQTIRTEDVVLNANQFKAIKKLFPAASMK